MTNAQKIIDWLTEHPNSLQSEIEKGTNLPWMFAGSYLGYMTKNGTLVYTGKKGERRYRVAEESDHPPAQSNGISAMDMRLWRIGTKIPINVYDGDRPVCQCQTVMDARLIVAAVNEHLERIADKAKPVGGKA